MDLEEIILVLHFIPSHIGSLLLDVEKNAEVSAIFLNSLSI